MAGWRKPQGAAGSNSNSNGFAHGTELSARHRQQLVDAVEPNRPAFALFGIEMPLQRTYGAPAFVSPVGASGGHGADGRPLTYRRALDLIENGTVDVAPIITHRYPSLDAVPQAFGGDHEAANYVKGVVTP